MSGGSARCAPSVWRVYWPRPYRCRWELKIPVSIRDYRDVTNVEEYIDMVGQRVVPPEPPPQPLPALLDIPYAESFADAVWQSRTGHPAVRPPGPG